jgi:hypothetical protein
MVLSKKGLDKNASMGRDWEETTLFTFRARPERFGRET